MKGAGRGLFILFGFSGAAWALLVMPAYWVALPKARAAFLIVPNQFSDRRFLDSALSQLQRGPSWIAQRANAARAKALIRLRLAEITAVQENPAMADRENKLAYDGIRTSLAVSPTDSFVWLTLYSAHVAGFGFGKDAIPYLEQSYVLGPLEGWIALQRNRLALAAFTSLSDQTREMVVSEFSGLVEAGYMVVAEANLTSVGWVYRDRLATSLAKVSIVQREAFARKLARDGYAVPILGVHLDERVWR